jgi:predicted O-methyltransferase YrrM
MDTTAQNMADYLRAISVRESDVARRLREETGRLPHGDWSVSPEQAQILVFLVELIGAKRILELGTFTGYSALRMAEAMPADGYILTCDMEESFPAVGRPYWDAAGVAGKIELRMGPATETVQALIDEGRAGAFDFVFIDANKKHYGIYYEAALTLVRAGGLIALDNVFWGGAVLDAEATEKSTRAIRALNEKIHGDDRVNLAVLPVRDGMTLAVKRG